MVHRTKKPYRHGRLAMSDKETKGMRDAISRETKSLIKEGFTSDKARQIATDCAHRADRRAENER